LRQFGAATIYWHIGEMENRSGHWQWKAPPIKPPTLTKELRIVPAIRLSMFVKQPFDDAATAELIARIRAVAPDEVQLDTDCPDRLLADFASALKKIHAQVHWLSLTALESWCRKPEWEQLQSSVDEMTPMFYDVAVDPPVIGGATPLPLADPAKIEAEIAEWKSCKIPWRAGLPLFSRLTLYDGNTGLSRGHIRDWSWDDLCFSRAFSTVGTTRLGTTLLRADESVLVATTPVRKNDTIGVRWPDRAALAKAVDLAKAAGAAGVVFFRLPDSTDPSGWSLKQLAHPDATPSLAVRKPESQSALELTNTSDADLEPRLSGANEHDRGYALELEADEPIFREALEGDFWRVAGHVEADSKEETVAVPLATRLTFWFSHLRAGESVRTGLIQLAPGADFSQIRYRILNVPGGSAWKNIAP
jgi:hypothetical protein